MVGCIGHRENMLRMIQWTSKCMYKCEYTFNHTNSRNFNAKVGFYHLTFQKGRLHFEV